MLAAGVGRRLGPEGETRPKALIEVGGRTLLARHLEVLRRVGISELVLGIGHLGDMIEAELRRLGAGDWVRTVLNPHYAEGSVVTLAALARDLAAGGDVLLMDADVLYDRRLIRRLLETRHRNCFLLDRNIEPGDEPVKICVRDGEIVDFHKKVKAAHDFYGESVGFFRFSEEMGRELARRAGTYMAAGRRGEWYEEAIRDLLIESSPGTFGYEDVTGLPWIEIDFPEDVERARREILPRLEEA